MRKRLADICASSASTGSKSSGRKKWGLDSRELTDDTVTREKTSYTAQEQDHSIRAFRDETVAAIGVKNLIDVRSPDEYAGRLLAPAHLPQEQAQRAGHVPTSINVPWSKNANDDGTFKSDDELKALYADAGIDTGKDTIALCRIDERSSLTWFVLKEPLGHAMTLCTTDPHISAGSAARAAPPRDRREPPARRQSRRRGGSSPEKRCA